MTKNDTSISWNIKYVPYILYEMDGQLAQQMTLYFSKNSTFFDRADWNTCTCIKVILDAKYIISMKEDSICIIIDNIHK